VSKLSDLGASLSDEERGVFAEMIGLAVSQAQELQDQRASEVIGGASSITAFAKPISTVTSIRDLTTITQLRSILR
jgi:hypothetical protein